MAYGALFTLLPNGFTATGRARLSLVVSPRPTIPELQYSEVHRWPEVFAALTANLRVAFGGAGTPAPVRADIVSAPPEPAMWAKLFPPTTPVRKFIETPLSSVIEEHAEATSSYADEHEFLTALYAEAVGTDGPIAANHPVMRKVAGLNAWRAGSTGVAAAAVRAGDVSALLDPKSLSRTRLRDAATLLRGRGFAGPADALALVPRLRRIALTRATGDNPPPPPPPGPFGVIADPEHAHFAQIVGAVLRHPHLALRLGLRIDLEMPAFTGRRLIRVIGADGQPLNGTLLLAQPWSVVDSDPATGRFVMATEADDRTEIVGGMLDVRPDAGNGRYTLSTLDVTALGQKLDLLAARIADGTDSLTLPARRTAGVTLTQADRRSRKLRHMLARNARFEGPEPPAEVDGAPVLYADDVTTGYRVDISADGGEFRSLMQRVVSYSLGVGPNKTDLTVEDEAQIDAIVPVQQVDAKNKPHVFIGDEMFNWNGWGFGGQLPGPVVGAETPTAPHVIDVDDAPLPGYPLRVRPRVRPGSLTRLRFGRRYRFRVRAVDLAGNSVEAAAIDPALVTAEQRYVRFEPVAEPVAVPRRKFRAAESLTSLVVYSDGDGVPIGANSERHLAAPKTPQRMAELHGMFDAAFGPGAGQAARDRMLAIARREEGSFLDPVVVTATGTVPAAGIAVVTNDPDAPPVTQLPVPRGEPLKPGEYIVHDNDAPRLPYLPDVAARGVALVGLPGQTDPLVVPYATGDQAWPDRPPVRLVVRAAPASAVTTEARGSRNVVTVDLAPAQRTTVVLSSALTPDGLDVMDAPVSGPLRKAALAGQLPMLSTRQELEMVHAVRKPLTAPTMSALDPSVRYPEDTSTLTTTATIGAHAPSTGTVAIEASWTELVDRGYGPVVEEDRTVTVASRTFGTADTTVDVSGSHDFGDGRRRLVRFRPVAVTRFGEYFPDNPAGELRRDGAEQEQNLISRVRPKAPRILQVVPMMQVEREMKTTVNGVKFFEASHGLRGFRVYLKRPWCTSGAGERLGVVVARNQETGNQIVASAALRRKLSRYGADLLENQYDVTDYHFDLADFFAAPLPPDVPPVQIPGIKKADAGKFALATSAVTFDPESDSWVASVFVLGQSPVFFHPGAFVRLGLVAYQPTSYYQDDAGNLVDLRSSPITFTDPIHLPLNRTASGKIVGPGLAVQVQTSVAVYHPNTVIRARWQWRPYGSLAPDMCIDHPLVPMAQLAPASPTTLVKLTLTPPSGLGEQQLSQLRNGRILIEEVRVGWSLAKEKATEDRVIFTESVEVSKLS